MKKWMILLAIGAFSKFLSAQEAPISASGEFERLGQTTMTFLDIDVGARAVGMGSAFTCMDGDVNALYWNPAGVARIKGRALSISNTQWIADIGQYAFAAAYGAGNLGTFGVSFMIMDNGELERTIPIDPGVPAQVAEYPQGYYLDGTYTVQQWVAGLAYARQITDKFSIGGQIKYVYEDLGRSDIAVPYDSLGEFKDYKMVKDAENNEGTIALDFGTIYYFGFKDLRIGMSFRNFAQPVTYAFESFNLPVTFKIAVSMDVLSLFPETENHQLQISVVSVNPYDGGERIHIGSEYIFRNLLALRAGYRWVNFKNPTNTGAFSAGFGLAPGAFSGTNLMLDYAYSNADEAFSAIHRFSFGFAF